MKPLQGDWRLAEYRLPDSVEAIERGRQEQRQLLKPDDSREARILRIYRRDER